MDGEINTNILDLRENKFNRLMELFTLLTGLCIIITGSVVVYGWLAGKLLFTSLITHQVSIKMNTAISFILIGISLILQVLGPRKTLNIKVSRICSVVIALIGVLTTVEYIFNITFGIDQLIVKEGMNALLTSHPGRMALNTAFAIFFIGAGLYLNTLNNILYTHRILLFTLGFFVIGFGSMSVIGYYSGAYSLPVEWNITLMALPTAFMVIALGAVLIYFAGKMSHLRIVLDRKIILWFLTGILLLAFISILSYRSTIVTVDTERWVTRTNTVILGIRGVLFDLKDAETGQRGYLITGFDHYLIPYIESIKRVDRDIIALQSITSGNYIQQKRVDTLKVLSDLKLGEMKQTIELRKSSGFAEAQKLVLTNRGQMLMEKIRSLLDRMSRDEFALLDQRRKASDFYIQSTLYSLPIGAFLSIFFLVAAFLVVNREINARRKAEEDLQQLNYELEGRVDERTAELKRSNAELEQFAYVASHDLQEPLRMVASYTQLLAKRYKGQLDSDADDFINYAVDGACRMQRLINDLLSYSRIKTQGRTFCEVNSEDAFRQAVKNLSAIVEESRVKITYDKLPIIRGDETQIVRLFQNLIDNAIKYHGEQNPEIHISSRATPTEWIFQVRDNGIGIDPIFNTKIFEIFERLHSPVKYTGTGIGLAICKRIVERHGGNIWVESKPGEGANFYFTLKKGER